jgi:hypothetical protein
MPIDKRLHRFKATSATARIDSAKPKVASVDFMLAGNGDFLSVEIPQHVLGRLVASAQRAIRQASLRAQRRLAASRSAVSRNK